MEKASEKKNDFQIYSFLKSFSLLNSTFLNNNAFSYSNVMDITCNILSINFCNFTANTPLAANWRSLGATLFGKLSHLLLNNTIFFKNRNFAGGAIFLEQHEKFSTLTGIITNIRALYNYADDDGSFLDFSIGLHSIDFSVEFSVFDNNRCLGCKLMKQKYFFFY